MKRLNNIELFGKFWNAQTTLSEEIGLKKMTRFSDDELSEKIYFQYLANEKLVPEMLEEDIWTAIELKNHRPTRRIVWLSVAASVAIVLGISGYLSHQQRQADLEMQFSLIEQTLDHVSNELTTDHKQAVIYEDQLITIVAEN